MNVDPAEIAKFAALAERWWDPEGDFKPLHQMNPVRLDYIAARSRLADCKALDVGCGGGLLTEGLARAGAEVTGIDMGEAPLAVARLHAAEQGLEIRYLRTEAGGLAAAEAGGYDLVCCLEVLEHVPDPAALVRDCAALCRDGGDLYFSTINRNLKAWLLAIVGAEYVLRLLPRGTHEYDKLVRPSELAAHLRAAGLQLRELRGLRYNPISGHFRICDDVDVNYMVHAVKAS